MRLYNENCDAFGMNPLVLAFIGDGVFDLMVRERLACSMDKPVGILNKNKVEFVCCTSQSKSIRDILDFLTETEMSVYKRGRNAKVSNVPKNASQADYHAATGLEALFGFLYMSDNIERLKELFNMIMERSCVNFSNALEK